MSEAAYININTTCGKKIVSRADGKIVHDLVISHWNQDGKIRIDFGNILIASVSFIDEIFGRLALDFGKHQITSKLSIENIQEFDRVLLNNILVSRFREKELKEQSSNDTPKTTQNDKHPS